MIKNIFADIKELVSDLRASGHTGAALIVGLVIAISMSVLFILGLPFIGLNLVHKL